MSSHIFFAPLKLKRQPLDLESLFCSYRHRTTIRHVDFERANKNAKASFQSSVRRHIHSTTSISNTTKKAVAADDAISLDHATTTSSLVGAQYVPPRPIFPWRSLSDPLPRLQQPIKPTASIIPIHKSDDGNSDDDANNESRNNNSTTSSLDEYYAHDYFTRGGPLGPGWPSPMESWFRLALYVNSMHLLGVSWPSIIMPWTRHDWESEMGHGFCTAFALGVRGMMEDVYLLSEKNGTDKEIIEEKHQLMDDEESDGYDVDVDILLDPLPLSSEEGGGDIDTANTRENNSTTVTEEKTIERTTATKPEDGAEIYDNEEHYMLQRQLRQLYQSAKNHSHPSKVNILLRTIPQSAKIESMFPIFGLSRSLVYDHPHLRHTYRNMIKRLQSKHKEAYLAGRERLNPIEVGTFISNELQNVMDQSAKLSTNHMASITIVAQVSIHCKEIFCVRDVDTGVVLQGCGEDVHNPRDVTHLVRFEMVVRERLVNDDDNTDSSTNAENEEDGKWEIEMGRWQITDWDDLLDGNVFFT